MLILYISLVEAYFEEFSTLKLTSLKKYPDFIMMQLKTGQKDAKE
jgi:hypothetical protein